MKSSSKKNPSIDIASLAAFNSELASLALAQAYADGDRELALRWAPKLDIFKKVSLRDGSPEGLADFGDSRSGEFPRQQSLFSLVVGSADLPALAALADISPEARRDIYTGQWHVLCAAAGSMLYDRERAEFAKSLIANMAPEAINRHALGSEFQRPLSKLAAQAVGSGNANLLPHLNDMCRRLAVVSLADGRAIAAKAVQPGRSGAPDIDSLKIIFALPGFLEDSAIIQTCQLLLACNDEKATELALCEIQKLLSKSVNGKLRASEEETSVSLLSCALFMDCNTPAPWLALHLEAGLNPFVERKDCRAHLAARLLTISTEDAFDSANEGRHRLREDSLLPLLATMADAFPAHASERFSTIHVGARREQQLFDGVAKIDAVLLCAMQGFYKAADLLISKGADYKFASRQCSAILAKAQRFSTLALPALAAAHAYFEGLSLRDACDKSARRLPAAPASKTPSPRL